VEVVAAALAVDAGFGAVGAAEAADAAGEGEGSEGGEEGGDDPCASVHRVLDGDRCGQDEDGEAAGEFEGGEAVDAGHVHRPRGVGEGGVGDAREAGHDGECNSRGAVLQSAVWSASFW